MPTTVKLDDILAAQKRIHSHIVRTPVLQFEMLDQMFGAELFFKCENLQAVGAFKARGACNTVFSLSDEEARRGVVTHSSGNHAAAVARAARLRGIEAHIVMPRTARPNKIAAVRRYGIEPRFCEPTAEARQQAADDIIEQIGAVLVHPYDDPRIIAGQGTTAIELLEQTPDLDIIITPVGGGGLLAGTLVAVKSQNPSIHIFGAEPRWADDAYRSLVSGERQMPNRVDTIADGLQAPLGELNWSIIRELVNGIHLASESTIAEATRLLLAETKLVVEPSGALPIAVLLEQMNTSDAIIDIRGKRVGVILSGGNLDLDQLPWQ